jgi:uncharacterized protein (TIGR03435 family)
MNCRAFKSMSLAAGLIVCCGVSLRGQTSDTRPRFEVTVVKRNLSGCAQGRGGGATPSPGSLRVTCITVKDLIQSAYGTFANGPAPDPRMLQVVGAPQWIESEVFDVNARPSGQASLDQMYGPMLQTLLEDRFGLRIHRETREVPVYILTVDSGGPRLPATAPGTCAQFDPANPPPQPRNGQAPVALCGRTSIRRNGPVLTIDAFGVQMGRFAGITLSVRAELDRPVIDRTGLEGMFDVHLAFKPDLAAAAQDGSAAAGDAAPSIFTALRELGLKLSPGKGPVEVLVVDRISHPSGN